MERAASKPRGRGRAAALQGRRRRGRAGATRRGAAGTSAARRIVACLRHGHPRAARRGEPGAEAGHRRAQRDCGGGARQAAPPTHGGAAAAARDGAAPALGPARAASEGGAADQAQRHAHRDRAGGTPRGGGCAGGRKEGAGLRHQRARAPQRDEVRGGAGGDGVGSLQARAGGEVAAQGEPHLEGVQGPAEDGAG